MSRHKDEPRRSQRPARQAPGKGRGWLLAAAVAVVVAAVVTAVGGYALERWSDSHTTVAAQQGEAVPRVTLQTADGDYVVGDGSRAAEVLFFSFPG